jgi:hypothetical protein
MAKECLHVEPCDKDNPKILLVFSQASDREHPISSIQRLTLGLHSKADKGTSRNSCQKIHTAFSQRRLLANLKAGLSAVKPKL